METPVRGDGRYDVRQSDKAQWKKDQITTHSFPVVDQYGLMGDDFSRAILEDGEVPVSLEDGLANTKVLTAIFESSQQGSWVSLQ